MRLAFGGNLKVKDTPRAEAETLIRAILALFLPIKGEPCEPKPTEVWKNFGAKSFHV
jgi:hypothetical protein